MATPMAGRGAQPVEGLGMCLRKRQPSFSSQGEREPLWGGGGEQARPQGLRKALGAPVGLS